MKSLKLDSLQKHWETFARQDPMWAILTDPEKQNQAWDEDEFYATGVCQIGEMRMWMRWVLPLAKLDKVLDFGCGMGRLTQALAEHAGHVTGVDIAPTMIELARRNNRKTNCEFVCNQRGDLAIFSGASLDFVYTSITLQHIPPQFARVYLAEFFRILKPGGVLCFQLPTEYEWDRTALHRKFRLGMQQAKSAIGALLGRPVMEMHGYPEPEIRAMCQRGGMSIVALRPTGAGGPGWRGLEYLAVKALEETPVKEGMNR
jgi:SAM-dependent methyltransferase